VGRNIWIDLNNVAIDKCIIGRLELTSIQPIDTSDDRQNQQYARTDINKSAPLAVLWLFDGLIRFDFDRLIFDWRVLDLRTYFRAAFLINNFVFVRQLLNSLYRKTSAPLSQ